MLFQRRLKPMLSVCLLTTSVIAGSAQAQPDATPRNMVALSSDTTVARLVDFVASKLDVPIEYDKRALSGDVTLQLPDQISVDELPRLLRDILDSRDLAIVESAETELLRVVAITEAKQSAPLRTDLEGLHPLTSYIRLFITPPGYIEDDLLREFVAPDGEVSSIGHAGVRLISGHRARVEAAIAFSAETRADEGRVRVTVLRTENARATSVANRVAAAVAQRNTMGGAPLTGRLIATPGGTSMTLIAPEGEYPDWEQLIATFDRTQAIETRTFQPLHHGLAEVAAVLEDLARLDPPMGSGAGWAVAFDTLSGSLVVTGTEDELELAAELISDLNRMPAIARRTTRTIGVRYRDATVIADLIADFLEGDFETTQPSDALPTTVDSLTAQPETDTTAAPNPSTTAGDTAITPPPIETPTMTPPPVLDEAPLVVRVDPSTNSIIAIGSFRQLDDLERLVTELDVRQPQVMLEVMIVSLNDGQTRDLGLELAKSEVNGQTAIELASLFGIGLEGTGTVPTPGGGFSGVVIRPGDFAVLVRALETVNKGKTLSFPKALVDNNHEASLDSVLQQPVASINASTTVATTSFGGFTDAGTSISVTPLITAGNMISLTYAVNFGSFVGESTDASLPPPRQQNTLSSRASIPDGFSVVLGGLEVVTEGESVNRVPILGSLPLVGGLFRNTSTSTNRSRFFVFIRANIMRKSSFEELKYMSQDDLMDAGLDDGYPVTTPRVIR